MVRNLNPAMCVLAAVLGFPAASIAQDNVALINATAQLVDISRFRVSHPAFSIVFQDYNTPSAALNGQLPQYGGPLQYYVNTQVLYSLHDVNTPFGASAVLPVAHGRIELLGSAGGLFEPVATAYTRPNAWITQTTIGARLALDPGHHFWVGGNARHIADFAGKQRQYGLLTADFTFQSGH